VNCSIDATLFTPFNVKPANVPYGIDTLVLIHSFASILSIDDRSQLITISAFATQLAADQGLLK
jgi:hypothetical protein